MNSVDFDFEEFALDEIEVEEVPDSTGLPVLGASGSGGACSCCCVS
ncbi:thiopeptide-type bacteriocin [Streptomyces sp. NPDC054834]